MLSPEAILRWADRQKRLLRKTYDVAWQVGVTGYEPDQDPEEPPKTPKEWAIGGLTGVALLEILRQYPYEPPPNPDALRRAIALTPSFRGVNSMTAELTQLIGGVSLARLVTSDPEDAVAEWTDSNAWRLNAGASVAWAGEQAGFAEAANADGQLLYAWMSVGDNHVCSDCEVLSNFPALPLSEWPTAPGAGDTECNVGCRCTWDTWSFSTLTSATLSASQQALVQTLQDRQSDALGDMMAEAAYLD